MGVSYGTGIVREGLVLHIDQSNIKSWKGKPTTNMWAGLTTSGNSNVPTTTVSDILPNGKVGNVQEHSCEYIVDPNRTISVTSSTLQANTDHSLSFYVKNIDCTGFGGNLYSPTLGYAISNFSYPTITNNSWTRVIVPFTVPEYATDVVVSPQLFRDAGYGKLRMCWPQLELGTVSPYTSVTRTTSNSLVDISGSNTITINGLTYNSDETYSFTSADFNSISLPDYIGYDKSVSVFAWFKKNTSPQGGYHIICGGVELEISIPDPAGQLRIGIHNDTSTRFVSNHGSGLVDGNWHYVGMTFSGTTKTGYIDGENVGSVDNVTGTIKNTFLNRKIGVLGSNSAYAMSGDVPVYQVYNRVLNDAEVKRNFNAMKGRYGL